jgi:excisionase family DNA binding protein
MEIDMPSDKKLLSPSEAAAILNISPITIKVWAQDGKIPFSSTLGGHRRFKLSDINNILDASKRQHKTKILIAEDDIQLGEIIVEMLTHKLPDAEVKLARGGFEVGDLLHTFKPSIVILDLFMPHIDGFSICKRIKQDINTRDITIIAITGACTDKNKNRILGLGASFCLPKPLDFNTLVKYLTMHTKNENQKKVI